MTVCSHLLQDLSDCNTAGELLAMLQESTAAFQNERVNEYLKTKFTTGLEKQIRCSGCLAKLQQGKQQTCCEPWRHSTQQISLAIPMTVCQPHGQMRLLMCYAIAA